MPSLGKGNERGGITPKKRSTNAVKTRPSNSNSGENPALQESSSKDQVKKGEDSKNEASSFSGLFDNTKKMDLESVRKLAEGYKEELTKIFKQLDKGPAQMGGESKFKYMSYRLLQSKARLYQHSLIGAEKALQKLTKSTEISDQLEEDIKTHEKKPRDMKAHN